MTLFCVDVLTVSSKHIDTISEFTRKIAVEMNVVGLMNIQYAIYENTVYVLEANPRASRTVPLVSKVCNIAMARLWMAPTSKGLTPQFVQ